MRNINCTRMFKSALFIVDKADKIQRLRENSLGEQIMSCAHNETLLTNETSTFVVQFHIWQHEWISETCQRKIQTPKGV